MYHQEIKRSLLCYGKYTTESVPIMIADVAMIHCRTVVHFRNQLSSYGFLICVLSNTLFFTLRLKYLDVNDVGKSFYFTGISKIIDFGLLLSSHSTMSLIKLAIAMYICTLTILVEPFYEYSYISTNIAYYFISYFEWS